MERDERRAGGRREPGREDLREDLRDERELGKEGLREGHHDKDELRVQRTEEELAAGTREREAGEVKVRKNVRTDREQVRVPKRHEEVHVERVPVEEDRWATEADIGEDEIRMPVVEEEVVTEKRQVPKEEIRLRKTPVQEEEVVEEDVRREEVEIDDQTHRHRGQETARTGHQEEERPREAEEAADRGEGFIDKAKRKLEGN